MEGLNEEDKHKLEKEMAESEKRHKEHPKLNHPVCFYLFFLFIYYFILLINSKFY